MKQNKSGISVGKSFRILVLVLALWMSVSPIGLFAENPAEPLQLIPGGVPFGVRFFIKGAVVTKVEKEGAGKQAGLLPGDIICSYDQKVLSCKADLEKELAVCKTKKVKMEILRCGEKKLLQIEARKEEERYSIGASLRDTLSGIGTVTFYDLKSKKFAGLGHGICEEHKGALLPLLKGNVTGVQLTSIKKGQVGQPGQLRGLFISGNRGLLVSNTRVGVFGFCYDTAFPMDSKQAVPVAKKQEIQVGKAEIFTTLSGEQRNSYEVEIEQITGFDSCGKNYVIHVTDRRLLEKAGGIVQGMSGSPILQNGKIVGAVTHVFVDDPSRGYGIYIGKMMDQL